MVEGLRPASGALLHSPPSSSAGGGRVCTVLYVLLSPVCSFGVSRDLICDGFVRGREWKKLGECEVSRKWTAAPRPNFFLDRPRWLGWAEVSKHRTDKQAQSIYHVTGDKSGARGTASSCSIRLFWVKPHVGGVLQTVRTWVCMGVAMGVRMPSRGVEAWIAGM
jgi:hypothetical protein